MFSRKSTFTNIRKLNRENAENSSKKRISPSPSMISTARRPVINILGTVQNSRISKSEFSYAQNVSNDLDRTIESLSQVPPSSRKLSLCKTLNLATSKWKLKRSSRSLWNYCKNVSSGYEGINTMLEFPVFPERCGRLSHPAAQIWILTYGIKDVADDFFLGATEPDTVGLSNSFTQLIQEATHTKGIVKQFALKIQGITVPAMESLMDSELLLETTLSGQPQRRRQSSATPLGFDKSLRELVLQGSKIQSSGMFDRLRLYVRTNNTRKWFRFKSHPNKNLAEVITKGLDEVTSSLTVIRDHLQLVIDYLDRPDSCFHSTLESITFKMSRDLKIMLEQTDGLLSPGILQVGTTLKKCRTVVQSLQLNGKKFMVQILEVVAMASLCCKYVTDELEVPLKAIPLQREKVKVAGDAEYAEWDFETTDFFGTGYPDILRKVPVLINQNEYSLHKKLFPEDDDDD